MTQNECFLDTVIRKRNFKEKMRHSLVKWSVELWTFAVPYISKKSMKGVRGTEYDREKRTADRAQMIEHRTIYMDREWETRDRG
jgi:hypothetical protein